MTKHIPTEHQAILKQIKSQIYPHDRQQMHAIIGINNQLIYTGPMTSSIAHVFYSIMAGEIEAHIYAEFFGEWRCLYSPVLMSDCANAPVAPAQGNWVAFEDQSPPANTPILIALHHHTTNERRVICGRYRQRDIDAKIWEKIIRNERYTHWATVTPPNV